MQEELIQKAMSDFMENEFPKIVDQWARAFIRELAISKIRTLILKNEEVIDAKVKELWNARIKNEVELCLDTVCENLTIKID